MNLVGLIFSFITYALIKSMVIAYFAGSGAIADSGFTDLPEFPTFNLDTDELFDFIGVGGLNSIAEATENIAIAIQDAARIIFAIISFIGSLLLFIGQLFLFLIANAFTGIDDAPPFINLLLVTPAVFLLGMILYKSVRSGEDEA